MKFILYFTALIAATTVQSKELKNNSIGLELLGRGFLYSLFYERSISDNNLQVGVGISFYETPIIPTYINTTITQNDFIQTYLTAGVLITDLDRTFEGRNNGNNNGIYKYGIPMAGIGLNAKLTDSISLRGTAYAYVFIGPISMILPWIGGSMVYDF